MFNWLVSRNAVRRESSLPPIDVHAEFRRLVALHEWKRICEEHYDRVAAEILKAKRAKYPDWGNSAGGRWALRAMTLKMLRERYVREP